MKKWLLSTLLILCIMLALLPGTAKAADLGLTYTATHRSNFGLDQFVVTNTPDNDANAFIIQDGILTKYIGVGGHVVIPDSVTVIGDSAFEECEDLVELTIPHSVTKIGDHAFYACTNMVSVTIPDSVVSIGRRAFEYCESLTQITIPNGITKIDDGTFASCKSLRSVSLPISVTKIGDAAFDFCVNLNDIIIPNRVTEIGDNAFYFCTNLTSITIPDSVTSIGLGAFWNCQNLESVIISNSNTIIGADAFYNTPWLEDSQTGEFVIQNGVLIDYLGNSDNVIIPDNVTKIGEGVFGFRKTLASVTISGNVTAIGANAFADCFNLTSVIIDNGVTSIDKYAFSNCTALTHVVIPNTVSNIGYGAFEGTPWLKNMGDLVVINTILFTYRGSDRTISIPNGVTSISDRAFEYCKNLTSIYIPDSVTFIGDEAFKGCSNLSDINIPKNLKSIGWNAFGGIPFNVSPSVRLAIYQSAQSHWLNPGQHVESQSDYIVETANKITAGLISDYEKAKAINDWVAKNIKYDYILYELDIIAPKSPEMVLSSKFAVCSGYASLTRALLQAVGIPSLYVVGEADNGKDQGRHAWNEAFIDGRWVIMDTTWDSTGNKTYFDMSLAEFTKNHLMTNRLYELPNTSDNDIPSDWAQDEVWNAIITGLVPNELQSGYRNSITREEFCHLMVALIEKASNQSIDAYLKSKGLKFTTPFTDTKSEAVLAAYTLGIVSGTSETTFDPYNPITRQEAATMLARTAKTMGLMTRNSENYSDTALFASWASESIAFISGLTDPITSDKVMGGTGKGLFSPLDNFTREQAILTALRIYHCSISVSTQ